jgi:hypothetical protein
MRIAASSVELTSSRVVERTTSRSESLELWVGSPPRSASSPAQPAPTPSAPAPAPASAAATDPAEGAPAADAPDRLSPHDALDLAILREFFGLERDPTRSAREARAAYEDTAAALASSDAAGGAAPAPAGWGLRYDRTETSSVHEATAFAAQAKVTTADGRSIDASVALTMERSEVTSSEVHVRAGDAARAVDPLVLNLGGGAAAFAGRTSFDLDADGREESVARLAAGSAYLALDRNGNGKVDSGAELFGPTSGSGFGELAALDQDQNGWIDEGDAAFGELRLWDQTSGALRTLKAAGVGAIYARAAATPFELRDGAGAAQASVAQTGVYLREDGGAGTVQHVDLVA